MDKEKWKRRTDIVLKRMRLDRIEREMKGKKVRKNGW